MRKAAQLAAVAAASVGLVAVGAPAQASSGGGCRNTSVVGSCISYSSGSVHGDFYLNAAPDSSRKYAVIQIINQSGTVIAQSAELTLTRTGRYGPISKYVLSNPPKSGSSYTHVIIRTSTHATHFTADSPRVYYP